MADNDYALKVQELEKKLTNLTKENRELLTRNLELIEQNRQLGLKVEKLSSKINFESADKKSIRYKMVTVFFADIKGFSKLSEQDNAKLLIDELDNFFLMLDEIIRFYNIKKISTQQNNGAQKQLETKILLMMIHVPQATTCVHNAIFETPKIDYRHFES